MTATALIHTTSGAGAATKLRMATAKLRLTRDLSAKES